VDLRHLPATPTAHVQRVTKGRIIDDGTGLSSWFRPLTSAISELPIEEQERPLLFRARTADLQEVAVQATITYRIGRPVAGDELVITSSTDGLVLFGDGIESDRVELRWGQRCRINER